MSMHRIENECLQVTVSDAGAELISVFDKERNAERIWTGDPAVWNRHAPILFPFVGKVYDGKYRIDDKEFDMKTQHGFARDLDFACVKETENCIAHCLSASDWTRERYPYEFRLTVTHRLEARQLHILWQVENLGKEQMYFAIGGHPGFLLPEGIRKEDCRILFPGAGKTLSYRYASKAGYVMPEAKTLSLHEESACYQADIPDTWIFEDGQVRNVGIALPDGKQYILLHCDQFPMLAVWANPKGPFICLEPWFGRADDEGFDDTISRKKDIQSLQGKEKKDFSYTIDFI